MFFQENVLLEELEDAFASDFYKTFEDVWQGQIFPRLDPCEVKRKSSFFTRGNYDFSLGDQSVEISANGFLNVSGSKRTVLLWAKHLFANNRSLFREALCLGFFSNPKALWRDLKKVNRYQNGEWRDKCPKTEEKAMA